MSSANQAPAKILNRFLDYGIYFFIFWYLFLCVVNYLNQRPLWNDEECVFLSIKSFTPKQMFTQELMSLQVFPRVYLFGVQFFSRLFDFHVLSLRFPSFVCMVLAFFIWLRLAKDELKDKLEYLTFVLSWCASSMLIYYSSELKQYSMVVLAASLYVWFIFKAQNLKQEKQSFIYAGILSMLPFLGLLSYTAFFFPPIVLYNLIVLQRTDKSQGRDIFILVTAFCVSLTISYLFDTRLRPSSILSKEWQDYFISLKSAGEFFKTFGEGVMNLFVRWFTEHPRMIKRIGVFFVALGMLNLFYSFFCYIRKEQYLIRSLNTIALVIFLELFIAGMFKKYPFTVPRTSLFYCPIVFYLTVKGIGVLKGINKYAYITVQGLFFIFLLFLTLALSGLIFTGQTVFAPVL